MREVIENRLSIIHDGINGTLGTGREGIQEYALLEVGLGAGVGIIIWMLLRRNSRDLLCFIRIERDDSCTRVQFNYNCNGFNFWTKNRLINSRLMFPHIRPSSEKTKRDAQEI